MAHSDCSRGFDVADLRLCLDFVNTEGEVRNDPPDRLENLDLFFEWAARHYLTDEDEAAFLRDSFEDSTASDEGRGFLDRAREFREALYRIMAASARGEIPKESDLSILNRELSPAIARVRFEWGSKGFAWVLQPRERELHGLLGPIAISAADLLRSDLLERVKECNSDTCSWMFIDESRNRSRRWCDMSDCGNRAKARRFYNRRVKGQE